MNSDQCAISSSSNDAAAKTLSKRTLVCKVCGDAASGFNFGAIVCESCKSFYRRHVHRRPNFMCAASGACMLNHDTRRHCPACRMEKCFAVGMRRPSNSGHEHQSGSVRGNSRRGRGRGRYSMFVRRLLQRVSSRPSAATRCKNNSETSQSLDQEQTTEDVGSANPPQIMLNNDKDYEQLYSRISAASRSMLTLANRSIAGQHDVCAALVSPRDGTAIRLAMSGYIESLQHLTELGRLDRTAILLVLREQMLDQLNLYSMFAVNCDTSGWFAVDAAGVPREQAFADFVQCLTRDADGDGVQVQFYVDLFLALVRSFRASFEHDWPVVLLTIGLVNLLSPKQAAQYCSRVDDLRKMYEGFLEHYLRREYSVSFESRFYYCTDKFPSALRRLVQVHRRMFAQLASRASSMPVYASTTLSTEHALSAQVGVFLEPLVSYIANCLSELYRAAS